jgi:hypothetical protein
MPSLQGNLVSTVGFLLRAAGWIGLHLAAVVAGVYLGAALSPRVDPHNDWGATSMLYSLVGALIGSSGVIVLMLWWYEKPRDRRKDGTGRDAEV